ncbi:MAG: chemotaxis protein CheW [Pseudomonadota bacterium]
MSNETKDPVKNLDPFEVLLDIEHRSKTIGGASPTQEEMERFWTGVGFKLNGKRYVTPLDEVSEILIMPHYTKVPGVKPWVKGISNVRGTLLPVMDLNGFLGFGMKHANKRQRILVVNHDNTVSGIIVDEVLGLQHFEDFELVNEAIEVDSPVQSFVSGAFQRNDERWLIFSLYTLAENPAFLQVAI